jgi:hypothetical protein
VVEIFGISQATAMKYVFMIEEEISKLDNPINYRKRESPMNA